MGALVDLTGKLFGELKVLQRVPSLKGHNRHAHWACVCTCGKRTTVRSNLLITGNTRSCGCLNLAEDLSGKAFGNLRVLNREGRTKYGKPLWKCECTCGEISVTSGYLLRSGQARSCGCLKKLNNLKHGLSYTSEYGRVRHSKRKAHKLENGGSHTASELLSLLEKQSNRCYYCGKQLDKWHQEHKTPLSRGGSDNIENIVISCPPCNLRKRDKTEEEFHAFLSENKTPA